MSAKKTDISQISKYLKGELDNAAMHRLEHDAHNDPFLMEAIEGYELAKNDQQENLADLQSRLMQRTEIKKGRSILLWRILPLAACLLLTIGIGYWFLKPQPVTKQFAAVIHPLKTETKTSAPEAEKKQLATVKKSTKTKSILQNDKEQPPVTSTPQKESMLATVKNEAKVTYKEDTVTYNASEYKLKKGSTLSEALIGKVAGIEVNSDGAITHQGQQVTKVRLNGKDFTGGDANKAVKDLPADIVSKIQVIDDYGDQANKTGMKDGRADKVLNITTDSLMLKEVALDKTINRQSRIVANHVITGRIVEKGDGQPLPGVTVKLRGSHTSTQSNVDGTFRINAPVNDSVLDIAYIGYNSMQLKASKQENLKVELEPNSQALSEVVVIGYGTTKTNGEAAPLGGWPAYNTYLKQAALMPTGETGKVKLSFTVAPNGTISDIQVTSSDNKAMDDKAIEIILNGPKWIGGNKPKTVKIKIIFHKKA